MRALLRTIVCKFGRDPAICLQEEAIFVKLQKCQYHVTFDLDLDLEHTLDAGPSGDHRVQFIGGLVNVNKKHQRSDPAPLDNTTQHILYI